jgi:hypothetical protein
VFITGGQVKNGVFPKYPFLPCRDCRGDCPGAIPISAFGEKQTRPAWILFGQQTEKDRVKQEAIFLSIFHEAATISQQSYVSYAAIKKKA